MKKIHYSKGQLKAEEADTWRKKAKGLRLQHTGSMLFKMEEPSKPWIDMALVPEKLQIIFISEEMKVQEIIHAEPGLNFYKPEKPCKYFLETFSFIDIDPGEIIRISI